jgi:hypothetical protein
MKRKPPESFNAYLNRVLPNRLAIRRNILRKIEDNRKYLAERYDDEIKGYVSSLKDERARLTSLQADRDALAARCVELNGKVAALENIKAERDKALSSIVRLRHMIDQLYGESIDQVAKSL